MNARVLLFPLCTAAVFAVDACDGVSVNDPSVRDCYPPDTEIIVTLFPGGLRAVDTVVFQHDTTHCRKKAA